MKKVTSSEMKKQKSQGSKKQNLLSLEEKKLREEMLNASKQFAQDTEYAICLKIGLGACFKF